MEITKHIENVEMIKMNNILPELQTIPPELLYDYTKDKTHLMNVEDFWYIFLQLMSIDQHQQCFDFLYTLVLQRQGIKETNGTNETKMGNTDSTFFIPQPIADITDDELFGTAAKPEEITLLDFTLAFLQLFYALEKTEDFIHLYDTIVKISDEKNTLLPISVHLLYCMLPSTIVTNQQLANTVDMMLFEYGQDPNAWDVTLPTCWLQCVWGNYLLALRKVNRAEEALKKYEWIDLFSPEVEESELWTRNYAGCLAKCGQYEKAQSLMRTMITAYQQNSNIAPDDLHHANRCLTLALVSEAVNASKDPQLEAWLNDYEGQIQPFKKPTRKRAREEEEKGQEEPKVKQQKR